MFNNLSTLYNAFRLASPVVNSVLNSQQSPQPQQSSQIGSGGWDYGIVAGDDSGRSQQQYSQPQGQITPTAASTSNPLPTGGSGGGTPSAPQMSDAERAKIDAENRVRNEIDSGYSNYFSELNKLYPYFDSSRQNQEQMVTNSYNQSRGDLDVNNQVNQKLLDSQRVRTEENQTKNLRQLADDLINSQQSANVYLGTRGAGDSSASGMYSYALTKLANKQRGDVMSQTGSVMNDIDDRATKLQGIYTQEMNRLNTEKNQAMLGVAEWFNNAKMQVQQMVATGQLNKGQDLAQLSTQLLNQAISELDRVRNAAESRTQALNTWAQTNSQQIQMAGQDMSGLGSVNYNLPQAGQIQSGPTVDANGNYIVPPSQGGNDTEDKGLLGLGILGL